MDAFVSWCCAGDTSARRGAAPGTRHFEARIEGEAELEDLFAAGFRLYNDGNLVGALGCFDSSLRLARKYVASSQVGGAKRRRYRLFEGRALGNIAATHTRASRHQEAIDHYSPSLVIMHELGERNKEVKILGDLAAAHLALNELDISLAYHDRLRVLLLEVGASKATIARVGRRIALVRDQQAVSRALDMKLKALVDASGVADGAGDFSSATAEDAPS